MNRALSAKDVLGDLSWLWLIFATILGAPSILSLLQIGFGTRPLIDAFQWIIDGYNQGISFFGAMLEPTLRSWSEYIMRRLGWQAELQPQWKQVFVLLMVVVLSVTRAGQIEGVRGNIAFLILGTTIALVAALAGSFIDLTASWQTQALSAAFTLIVLNTFTHFAMLGRSGVTFTQLWDTSWVIFLASLALAAALSWLGVTTGLNLILVGVWLLNNSVASIWSGLRSGSRFQLRAGVISFGGFLLAGSVLLIDALVRLLAV